MKGGKISVENIKKLIQQSYKPSLSDVNDYVIDNELSGQRAQVYKKKGTNEAVVVHRGTKGLADLGNDVKLALGFDISNTNRVKHAKEVQQKAEQKYGSKNVSTVGHSLGSHISSQVGQNSKEIINLNKAVVPADLGKTISSKETNIRSSGDVISSLLPLQRNKGKTITIENKSNNPLTEHSTQSLDRLPRDQMIGEGFIRIGGKLHKI